MSKASIVGLDIQIRISSNIHKYLCSYEFKGSLMTIKTGSVPSYKNHVVTITNDPDYPDDGESKLGTGSGFAWFDFEDALLIPKAFEELNEFYEKLVKSIPIAFTFEFKSTGSEIKLELTEEGKKYLQNLLANKNTGTRIIRCPLFAYDYEIIKQILFGCKDTLRASFQRETVYLNNMFQTIQTLNLHYKSLASETTPEVKTEVKPEIKTEVKPEIKPETKIEVKTESIPEVKIEMSSMIKKICDCNGCSQRSTYKGW